MASANDITHLTAQQLLDLVNSTLAQGKAVMVYRDGPRTMFREVDAPQSQ